MRHILFVFLLFLPNFNITKQIISTTSLCNKKTKPSIIAARFYTGHILKHIKILQYVIDVKTDFSFLFGVEL